MKNFKEIAHQVGETVTEKNAAYGSSFTKAGDYLRILYPDGVKPEQYTDMLLLARDFDKNMRIANRKDAFGESPWLDKAGYAVLGASIDQSEPPKFHVGGPLRIRMSQAIRKALMNSMSGINHSLSILHKKGDVECVVSANGQGVRTYAAETTASAGRGAAKRSSTMNAQPSAQPSKKVTSAAQRAAGKNQKTKNKQSERGKESQ